MKLNCPSCNKLVEVTYGPTGESHCEQCQTKVSLDNALKDIVSTTRKRPADLELVELPQDGGNYLFFIPQVPPGKLLFVALSISIIFYAIHTVFALRSSLLWSILFFIAILIDNLRKRYKSRVLFTRDYVHASFQKYPLSAITGFEVITEGGMFCVGVNHASGAIKTLRFATAEQAQYVCDRMAQRLQEQRRGLGSAV